MLTSLVFRRSPRTDQNKFEFLKAIPETHADISSSNAPEAELDVGTSSKYDDKDSADDVPCIIPATSYDSTGTTTTDTSVEENSSPRKMPSLTIEIIDEKAVESEENDLSCAKMESPLPSPSYVSRDELETLLTPRFLDGIDECSAQFEEMQQVEADLNDDSNFTKALRRQLIQQELDSLIELMSDKSDQLIEGGEDEDDLEPEVVEALGIAANRVTYLKRFYDVSSSSYIYAPSLASAVLDGSLLEEAQKHYFGRHRNDDEAFLIAYAGRLGATVIKYLQQESSLSSSRPFKMCDPDDWSVVKDLTPTNATSPTIDRSDDFLDCHQHAPSQFCWGVSSSPRKSERDSPLQVAKGLQCNSYPSKQRSNTPMIKKCICGTTLTLVAVFMAFQLWHGEIIQNQRSDAAGPMNLSTPSQWVDALFVPPFVSETPLDTVSDRVEPDNLMISFFETVQRIESTIVKINPDDAMKQKRQKANSRPIVPNLWY